MDNDYTAKAYAETTQAAGGVTVEAVDIEGNIATSVVTTNAEAAIKGNGTISTTETIQVDANGIADALSGVMTPTVSLSGIKIAANILTSKLAAVQKAYIENVTITNAGDVTVISTLNNASEPGARAILGSAAQGLEGIDISFISGTANTATATAKAVNYAYVAGASITQAEDLAVTAAGSSRAVADISQGALSAGYVSIGVSFYMHMPTVITRLM